MPRIKTSTSRFAAPARLAASFFLLTAWATAAEAPAGEAAAATPKASASAPAQPRMATEAEREQYREATELLQSESAEKREAARTMLETLAPVFPQEVAGILGKAWLDGRFGDGANLEKAEKWLKMAGKAGNSQAWVLLAAQYAALEGEENARTATDYYRKAAEAEQDNPAAWLELGRRLLYGIGTEKKEKKGLEWLEKATVEGYHQGYVIFAEYLLSQDQIEQAIQPLRMGVEAEHLPSMEKLAVVLSQKGRSPEEQKEAVELLERAANGGLRSAQLTMIDQELQSREPRLTKVHGWLVGAARQNSAEAQQSLAMMYYNGNLSGIAEPVAAGGWFKLAAESGLPVAQFMYASMLERGEGDLTRDLAKALENYRAAKEQGHAAAALACARFAASGFPEDESDLPQAYALGRLAKLRGERQNNEEVVEAANSFIGEISTRMAEKPETFLEAVEAYKELEEAEKERIAEIQRQAAEAEAARQAEAEAKVAEEAEAANDGKAAVMKALKGAAARASEEAEEGGEEAAAEAAEEAAGDT